MEWLSFFIIVFILIDLPLIPIILINGIRADRLIFSIYLLSFLLSSYFISNPKSLTHLWIFFVLSSICLILINIFFMARCAKEGLLRPKGFRVLYVGLLIFPLMLTFLFVTGYFPESSGNKVFFSSSSFPSLTLISHVLSLAMLTLGWERIERSGILAVSERLFLLGFPLWWLINSFLLSRMIFTGDMVSIDLFRILFLFHLLWIVYLYRLTGKGEFLKLRVHPSPHLIFRATHTLSVIAMFAIFFWFEAFERKWELPPYSVEMAFIALVFAILIVPLFPAPPFLSIRRLIHHHLYVPEQDFALEVSLYLKVMDGKERLERILSHLQERFAVKAVALYRPDRMCGWRLYLKSPVSISVPKELNGIKGMDHRSPEGLRIWKSIMLRDDEGPSGYLVLFGKKSLFSWEEESLLRFWSETLGLLVKNLDFREKERGRERLALFSQAASFIIHDAKNLAQLLDLLLKNYHRLEGEERMAFIEEVMPGIEQARTRARRILQRLETFHPTDVLVPEKVDLCAYLKEIIEELKNSMKRPDIPVLTELEMAPWIGDKHALRTVIENILMNAIQATTEGEKIEVKLGLRHGGYLIEVLDHGIGISEEDRGKLFEPLFTRKIGGTGMGLYQAKVLVGRMGGEIGYSPNYPKGSIFHVWLDSRTDR